MATVGADREIRFRLLGPFEVVDGHGRVLALGGFKQRAVLAILLLHANEVVPSERLIDELWAQRPPGSATKTVQVYVSKLRRALGPGLLVTHGRGYMLRVEPGEIDADRFQSLVGGGRDKLSAGDPRAAGALLREALELWRGPPLADFAGESFATGEIARLEEMRLAALEDRVDADLALGEHAPLVGELEALALELGEPDAVGGVRHVEVEHRPDERQAAGLAGEAADHLGAPLDLAERSLEQVCIPYEIGQMPPGTRPASMR